jgi:hypothetical protein
MTTQVCSRNSFYQDYWNDDAHQKYWPVFHQPSERLTASKNPSHPELIFSPLHGVMEVWQPSKKRVVVNRFPPSTSTLIIPNHPNIPPEFPTAVWTHPF